MAGDRLLSRTEAESGGYVLVGLRAIRRRTTLSHGTIMQLITSGQLPVVKVGTPDRWQWRARPEEFEAWLASNTEPGPLPEDALSPIEAVAEMNGGRRVKCRSNTFKRLAARLHYAARNGRITRFRIAGVARYSRAEVAAAFAGVSSGRTNWYAILRQRLPAGRILIADVPKAYGVHRDTAYRWAKEGRYGAEVFEGVWTLDIEELDRRNRAHYGGAQMVPCARCGRTPLRRTPGQLRHGRPHCDRCLEEAVKEWLARGPKAIRNMDPDLRLLIWRKSQQKRTDDRSAQRDACRDSMKERWRSYATALALAEAGARARGVTHHPERVKSGVLSRASLDSERSRETRNIEAQVQDLWSEPLTQMEIANRCHVSPGRISQIAKDLRLPPRPRGRRPANV